MGKPLPLHWCIDCSTVQVISKLICAFFAAFCLVSVAIANQYSVELLDENDGFNTSIVFSIVQDKQGFLWFGTAYDGVMRFDGENVVNFRRDSPPSYVLKHNDTGNLMLDSTGKIWIGGWGSSVSVLNPETNEVRYYPHEADNPNTVSGAYVQSLLEDTEKNLWFGTRSKGLSRFNPATQNFQRFSFNNPLSELPSKGTSHERIWAINQIESQELWIATEFGLNRLNTQSLEFEYFLPNPEMGASGVNKIRGIHPMPDKKLLLGTHEGVIIFDINTRSFSNVPVDRDIALGPIFSILHTRSGQYWVTTRRGVYYFTEQDPVLRKVPLDIDDSCALTLFQDRQNIIWMSCEGRGIYKIIPQTFFKTLDHPIAQSAYSLTMANNGNLLIGTEADGVYQWDWRTDRLSPFAKTTTATPPSINRILQDKRGHIWFTDSQLLYQIDTQNRLQEVVAPAGTQNADKLRDIRHITQTRDGRIWIGTEHGVFVINQLDRPFQYYGFEPANPQSLSSSNISEIHQDRKGRIWIGTQTGLNLLHPETDTFERFYVPDTPQKDFDDQIIYAIYDDQQGRLWVGSRSGLLFMDDASNTLVPKGRGDFAGSLGVRIIIGDKAGNLWLVTQVGVMKYTPQTDQLIEFDERDGLSGARYFINLATQSDDGTIFISSRNGIHYFDPSLINEQPAIGNTVLTNFEVLGAPREAQNPITSNNMISLAPDENYVRFDFSTLDLLNARKIQYRYKLDGLDDKWIDNGTSNTVVYTNLRGGNYRFRVAPVISNTLLYDKELAVNLTIATPLWRQTWMLVLYAACLLFAISFYIRRRQHRHDREILRQKRFVTELEVQVAKKTNEIQQESNKLAAANRVKSQFLANMSHEIRTPLTAVIGLSESIIEGDVAEPEIKGEVMRIHKQSRHLLSLVNDILDVTKIEENKFELEPYEFDVCALLSELTDLFTTLAQAKGLEFNVVSQLPSNFIIFADGLRIKQVLINLLSNAVKFTENGEVTVIVSHQQSRLLFNVIDTGIGMSDDQIDKVFNVFTQADNSINRRFGGSGLGLALSQKLVLMMDGELHASSDLHKGSIFTFSLPIIMRESPLTLSEPVQESALPSLNGEVLLAEDHPDNRRFIARLLTRIGLTVTATNNGVEAIKQYKKSKPQLILLDIQMPEKDGIQTFKELRQLGAKQPIVAITANAMAHDIELYKQMGFDDCLTKPIFRQQLIDIISRYFDVKFDKESVERVLESTDFQDLRNEFIARLKTEASALEAAENPNEVADLAHKLGGAAELLGFKQIAKLAGEVESAAKKQPERLPEILEVLTTQMRQTTTRPSK